MKMTFCCACGTQVEEGGICSRCGFKNKKNYLDFEIENETSIEILSPLDNSNYEESCDLDDPLYFSVELIIYIDYDKNKVSVREATEEDRIMNIESCRIRGYNKKVLLPMWAIPILHFFNNHFIKGNDWRFWNAVRQYGGTYRDDGDQRIAQAFENFYRALTGMPER